MLGLMHIWSISLSLKIHLELVHRTRVRQWSEAIRSGQGTSLGNADFILCSAEDTTSSGLLFEHLLLMSIRIPNLDQVLVPGALSNSSVVELADDFLTDITIIEAAKS